MQLCNDLIAFVDEIRTNGLDQVKLSKTVGISHLEDSVKLSGMRVTWLL